MTDSRRDVLVWVLTMVTAGFACSTLGRVPLGGLGRSAGTGLGQAVIRVRAEAPGQGATVGVAVGLGCAALLPVLLHAVSKQPNSSRSMAGITVGIPRRTRL